jgi:hypothetical protein
MRTEYLDETEVDDYTGYIWTKTLIWLCGSKLPIICMVCFETDQMAYGGKNTLDDNWLERFKESPF